MNILINCSNLQGGGGVSVASSFIDCLSKDSLKDFKITLLLSEKVYKNLLGLKVQFNKFDNVIVKNIFGIRNNTMPKAPAGWNVTDIEELGWLKDLIEEPVSVLDSF